MTLLGRYRQQTGERRKRILDYTDFLESDEIVTDVDVTIDVDTDPPFVIDDLVIDPAGKKFAYFAQGGIDGQTYAAKFTVTTNGSQEKQDTVEFDVEEDE